MSEIKAVELQNYLNEIKVVEFQDYLDKIKKSEDFWSQNNFLDDIKDPWIRGTTAVLLENQRLFNENQRLFNEASGHSVNINLVKDIYSNLTANQLVGIQPLLSPTGFIFYRNSEGNAKYELMIARTRYLRCLRSENESQKIISEIDREIIHNLMENAATVSAWDWRATSKLTLKEKYESLYVKLAEISSVIKNKTSKEEANWIVTSPEIASIFEMASSAPSMPKSLSEIQYVGTVCNRWKLFKDPLFKKDQILLGYKGDNMDSGYFYCPYVPLSYLTLDNQLTGISVRYGKRLILEGSKFYARMNVVNFELNV